MANVPTILTAAEETAAINELSLDLAEMCVDVAGFVDPTPVSGAVSFTIAIARGEGALSIALSGVSMVPFVGDLARAGKLGKYVVTLEKAIDLAGRSERVSAMLMPLIQKLAGVLDLFPGNAGAEFARLRQLANDFLISRGVGRVVASRLPDIRNTFKFRTFQDREFLYKEAAGKLGVPGKVMNPPSGAARRALSSGTGDDAGHLIGGRFGAPGTSENLGLQNWRQNRSPGTYKDLEDAWAQKLKNGTGIEVTIQDVYKRGAARPFLRKVQWREIRPDGMVSGRKLDFANTFTAESRMGQGVGPTVPSGNVGRVIPFR